MQLLQILVRNPLKRERYYISSFVETDLDCLYPISVWRKSSALFSFKKYIIPFYVYNMKVLLIYKIYF